MPRFAGATDVLDVGCGRGEFLELLRAAGITARGLDLNHEMVEASRARGLEVAEGDALSYVERLPDDSLGGLFAAQVVEHLEPVYLAKLLEAASHKIRPGGTIVLETINPACWVAFFESYLRDLTHVRPLHPETLQTPAALERLSQRRDRIPVARRGMGPPAAARRNRPGSFRPASLTSSTRSTRTWRSSTTGCSRFRTTR